MDMVSSPQYPAPMPPMLSYADAMRPSPQYPQLDEYAPIVDEQQPYSRAPMAGPTVESPYLNVNFPYQVAIDQPDPGPQSGLPALEQRLAENDRVKAMLADRLANSPDQAAAVSSVSGQAAGYGTGFNRQPEPARISESARTLGRGDVQGDRNERTRRALAAGAFGPGPSGEQPNQVNPLMKEDKDALLARINKLNPVMNGTTPDYLNDRLRRSEPGAASQYMEQAQALSALEGKMNEQERQKLIADLRGDTSIRPSGASPTGRDEAKFKEYTDNYYRNRNEAQGRTATFNVMRNLQRRGLPPSQALVIAANMFPTTGDVGISPNYQPTIQGNLADLAKQAGENMLDPQARQRKFDAEQKDKDRENTLKVEGLRTDAEKARATEAADRGRLNSLLVYSQGLQEVLKDPNLSIDRRNKITDELNTIHEQIKPLLGSGNVQPAAKPADSGMPKPADSGMPKPAGAPPSYNVNLRPGDPQSPEYEVQKELRDTSGPDTLSQKTVSAIHAALPNLKDWTIDRLAAWTEDDFDKAANEVARKLKDPSAAPAIKAYLKYSRGQRWFSDGDPHANTNPLNIVSKAIINAGENYINPMFGFKPNPIE